MSVGVLSGEDILGLLDAVADRLEEFLGVEPATIVVVGGSFMALRGLRAGTADVDTITRIDDRLRGVVEEVAAERDLRPDWLNDRSAAFAPVGLDIMSCTTLFERRSLIVLGPPADFVFLMKLFAARSVDYDDMVALWPSCSFRSSGRRCRPLPRRVPSRRAGPAPRRLRPGRCITERWQAVTRVRVAARRAVERGSCNDNPGPVT